MLARQMTAAVAAAVSAPPRYRQRAARLLHSAGKMLSTGAVAQRAIPSSVLARQQMAASVWEAAELDIAAVLLNLTPGTTTSATSIRTTTPAQGGGQVFWATSRSPPASPRPGRTRGFAAAIGRRTWRQRALGSEETGVSCSFQPLAALHQASRGTERLLRVSRLRISRAAATALSSPFLSSRSPQCTRQRHRREAHLAAWASHLAQAQLRFPKMAHAGLVQPTHACSSAATASLARESLASRARARAAPTRARGVSGAFTATSRRATTPQSQRAT